VEEGLADAVDVYVEDIAFSPGDLERVASVADREGLPLRVHADQLGHTGAAAAAARLGARSADHLNHLDDEGVRALGEGRTAAVLLPASTLALDSRPMPEAMALVCARYRLPPVEALVGATVNAAWVLRLDDRLGSLAPGKRADLVVLDGPEVRMVPYRPGHNPVVRTFVGGVASE
jgi:imidazolonepropionase